MPIAAAFNSSKATLHQLHADPTTVKTVTHDHDPADDGDVVPHLAPDDGPQQGRRAAQLDGAQATTQKIMLYGMPLFFGVLGFNFQMGVLLYWLTTNLWTFGQQFFVIKAMGDDPEAVVRGPQGQGGRGQRARGQEADHRDQPCASGKPAGQVDRAGQDRPAEPPPTRPSDVERRARPSTRRSSTGDTGSNPAARQSQPANRKRKGGRH